MDPAEEWLGRQWLGQLFEEMPAETIRKKIKKRISDYIYGLLEKINQKHPPFRPELLCPFRKTRLVETNLHGKKEGMLIPIKGGFILQVEKDNNLYRKRTTIAHELGHTFFYDINNNIPTIQFNRYASRPWVREGYAYEIARLLLLPEHSIRSFIEENQLQPSLASLSMLASRYQVSYDILRKRAVDDLKIWDCIMFRSGRTCDASNVFTVKSISKGTSYSKFPRLPRKLTQDTQIFSELYSQLDSSFHKGRIEDKITIKGREYVFQSMSLRRDDECISLLWSNNQM